MYFKKKKSLLWSISFILIFCTSGTSQPFNFSKKLPPIDVLSLSDELFESGKISVKFYRNMKERNILQSGNNSLNTFFLNILNNQTHIIAFEPLFKQSLLNEDLKTQHEKYGLDLWYTLTFDSDIDVKRVYTELKKTSFFEVVEPVYKVHLNNENNQLNAIEFIPNDPRFNEQWHYYNTGQANGKIGKDIKLNEAWDIETGKPSVIVSVHDMGIQLNHPDLSQNIAINKGFNFIDNNDTISPGYHGTHVAGTIAAVNNNGVGVGGIAGGNGNTNSGIRLMSIQIFKGNRSGGLADGFVYAADHGAAISNNSWAYNAPNVYEISVLEAIDYFIDNGGGAALNGGLVIFAAGNVSRQYAYYPSSYERVINVAATNNRDEKANYSTFGSWVDISAPGGDYSNGVSSQVLSTTVNDGYAGDHGTSMASPHVAGVAGLVASMLSGKASASDVREIILSTTDNIDSLNTNFKGLLGSGRLNAFKAVQKANDYKNLYITASPDSFKASNQCNTIQLNWKLNSNNDSVIIAYSNVNDIASPINGVMYQLNDKIGNGKVIYNGKSNNFIFNKNDDSLHFFKIWSKSNTQQYSLSRTSEIVDYITINGSGAITENFNYPPYFPTQAWNVMNPDNDLSWYHTAGDTANTGAGDLYSMCMYNYQYNTLLGAIDYLKSPLFKIQNADSLQFSFWYAYQFRNTGHTIADSLELLISTDCGVTFSSLWKKGGSNLATVVSTADTAFYPFGMDKWKQQTIDLSAYKNAEKIQFAFKAINGKGNNIFIDNINLNKRFLLDADLVSINQPELPLCTQNLSPEIIVKNIGNQDITSLQIQTSIDNVNQNTFLWNGIIKKDETKTIVLNALNTSKGLHELKINLFQINGKNDDFILNNTLSKSFLVKSKEQMPMNLSFEENLFPSKNWYILQEPKDAITWTKTNLYGSKGSSSSIVLKNYLYNGKREVDDFISPIFVVDRNMDSAFLLFNYAHATKLHPDSLNYQFDSLEIAYSKDCGITWNTFWKKGGKQLQTINQTSNYDKEFFPNAADWKSDSIYIPQLFKIGDQTQFRFRNLNYFGNNLYLDNINIYSMYLAPNTKTKGFAIYPNPFNNQINVQHLNNPSDFEAIIIYDAIGKKVFQKLFQGLVNKNEVINTSNLKPGIYTVNLIYNGSKITEKLVKLN